MSAVSVRPAGLADVAPMSAVLIASITELCIADHRGDAAFLSRWLANKTPAAVSAMLANPEITPYVAERTGEIAAVGCVGMDGEIGLNYVAPSQRFQGVSKTLLAAMEDSLRRRGLAEAHLTSTATAHRFYLDAGWQDTAANAIAGTTFPMRKLL